MASTRPTALPPMQADDPAGVDAALWDALPGMLLLLARDGAVLRMNPAFSAYAGLPPQGAPDLAWMSCLASSSTQALQEALQAGRLGAGAAVDQDRSFSLQLRLRATEGQPERWAACAARWRALPAPAMPAPADGNGYWICLLHDLHDQRAALARVSDAARHDARHDTLTGLSNRQAFAERLGQRMSQARVDGTPLALLFIDLDHFQRITDSLGHPAGDGLLQAVAGRIAAVLAAGLAPAEGPGLSSPRLPREASEALVMAGDPLLARFGGDEFLVLLSGCPSPGNPFSGEGVVGALDSSQAPADAAAGRIGRSVEDMARRLLAAIEAPVEAAGRPISVTASIGIALFPGAADTPAELIRHADTAMYLAKARGRATWQFFEPALATSAYAALVMEGELAQALERGELRLHFQPQVRAHDGALAGAEALVRWRHPERGLLPPDEFIPLAEQLRLMLPLGAWVMREAALTAQRWHRAGLGGGALPVAVNLSMRQFQADGFVEGVAALLHETGLPPGLLELELTERMLMDDQAQALTRIAALKALGVGLSVDDFGTGHSSLGHLKSLPIDKMKIDRSFVTDLPDNGDAVAIARAIIQMGRSLGITVVAEGVETEAQRRFLAQESCDELQGDGISPPLPAAAFEAWAAGLALQRP